MSLQKIELADFVSLSKKEIAELVIRNIEIWCESGDDTLSMAAMICKIEAYASDAKRSLALRNYEEVCKYGNEGVTKNGVKFDKFSSSKYDYSNSAAWLEVKKQMKPLEDSLKDIEQIAKATKQKSTWVDSDGAEWDVYPAIKTTTETVKATIK